MHTRDPSTIGSDTLTTPVLLVTIATKSRKAIVGRIATNSWKARFSIGPSKCYIKKATEKSVYASRPPKLVYVSESPESEESEASV
jgi:hypothetical protein